MEVTAQAALPVPRMAGDAPKFHWKEQIQRAERSNPILNFNLVEHDRFMCKRSESIHSDCNS